MQTQFQLNHVCELTKAQVYLGIANNVLNAHVLQEKI
jgi:hypothetical protein